MDFLALRCEASTLLEVPLCSFGGGGRLLHGQGALQDVVGHLFFLEGEQHRHYGGAGRAIIAGRATRAGHGAAPGSAS